MTKDVTFKQLCAKLEKTKRTTETMAQYLAMTRDEQTDIKDVGGFVGGRLEGGIRKRGHVRDNSLITLDLDDALPTTCSCPTSSRTRRELSFPRPRKGPTTASSVTGLWSSRKTKDRPWPPPLRLS